MKQNQPRRENHVQIRPLKIDDYDAMIDLWQRSGLTSVRPRGRDCREGFTQLLGNSASANRDCTLQAVLGLEKNGQLIGVVIATHDGRKGWINRLAVDPKHRRQRHASQLIVAAEQFLRAQGIAVIAALVERHNKASLALFQGAGYQLADHICYLSKRENAEA
jgi:ribosomal protein S18 acetylase RimI-like enzyme